MTFLSYPFLLLDELQRNKAEVKQIINTSRFSKQASHSFKVRKQTNVKETMQRKDPEETRAHDQHLNSNQFLLSTNGYKPSCWLERTPSIAVLQCRCDVENLNGLNCTSKNRWKRLCNTKQHNDVVHECRRCNIPSPASLPALAFRVIPPFNCTGIFKRANVYFHLMTKCWLAVTRCIVMCCPQRLYKSIYCSVNLFNRWKSRGGNQYQNKYKLVSDSQPCT